MAAFRPFLARQLNRGCPTHREQHGATDDIPLQAAEAARGTLGGAIATAQQLPTTVRANLVSVAREAFAEGLEMTAAVGAVVALATAVVAVLVLRRTGRAQEKVPAAS